MTEETFKHWIDFAKFLLGTFAIGIVTIVINYQIQNRELELKELDKLGNYVDHALEENVGVRRRFSQYFATVTRSGTLRERWKEYNSLVEKEYQDVVSVKKQKQEIERQLQEANLKGESVGTELVQVRAQILALEQELKVERRKHETRQKVVVQAFWHEEGFTFEEAEKLKLKLENLGIPTAVQRHIDPKPPDSVFLGALVNANDARLVLSSLPYEVKYIFPLSYPKIEGGDPDGFLIGIGYNSTHNEANRNKDNTPIRLSKEQFQSLIEAGISNTEFQLRLRNIAVIP